MTVVGSAASTANSSLLAAIVAATRRIVEVRTAQRPAAALEREIVRRPQGAAFAAALVSGPAPRVIAECKRRSPSRGILRADYDPVAIASSYGSAGAVAVSVLTEPTFFDGSPDHLRAVRAAVSVPLLRKDFLVAGYQLLEAAVLGADAVLLIVGAVEDDLLRRLLRRCGELGLAALVEVHDEEELRRALVAEARIIGVNSRNLRTLGVDPAVLDRLRTAIPDDVVSVAESGLRTPADVRRLMDIGYDAFLVGERLMSASDPGAALRELRQV